MSPFYFQATCFTDIQRELYEKRFDKEQIKDLKKSITHCRLAKGFSNFNTELPVTHTHTNTHTSMVRSPVRFLLIYIAKNVLASHSTILLLQVGQISGTV